jgi:uncharacterized protein YdhG (YjbR/CyaY superfamily)
MAEKRAARKAAQKSAKKTAARGRPAKGFTDEERAAMRERVKELNARGNGDEERSVLEKIAAMAPPDRALGERVHALIRANAPELSPRLWYGMPAYAKDGAVVCHFQDARKFKTRYATIGFSDKAKLDEGHVWPVAFALKELTAADEARIVALLKKAMG